MSEGRRDAAEVQREGVGAVGSKIQRRTERSNGLRVVGRTGVVVEHGHRLETAVNDGPFGKRALEVADLRAAAVIQVAIHPCVEDAVVGVVVALEVVDRLALLGGEAPEIAFIGAGVAQLVDLPRVRGRKVQRIGCVTCVGRNLGCHRLIRDRGSVGPEVDLFRHRPPSRSPAQPRVDADVRRTVRRIGLERLHRHIEEPHFAQADTHP